jgi:phytoene synthase
VSPHDYCERKAAQSGSSFYYSFRLLPPPRRRAITALYAFCREVDDVVDEVSDSALARIKLAWWRNEIAAVFGGVPQHPVALALRDVVAQPQFPLQRSDLLTVIDGMEMDLAHTRYLDFAALELYCERVAGVVGRMSALVFGYTDARTPGYARDLGIAFQLTNIVRDVGEDARRGRIYLPLEDLARFGLDAEAIADRRCDRRWRDLMVFECARTRALLESGRPLVHALPWRLGLELGAVIAGGLRVLERIDAVNGDIFNARPALRRSDWALVAVRALGAMRGARAPAVR